MTTDEQIKSTESLRERIRELEWQLATYQQRQDKVLADELLKRAGCTQVTEDLHEPIVGTVDEQRYRLTPLNAITYKVERI